MPLNLEQLQEFTFQLYSGVPSYYGEPFFYCISLLYYNGLRINELANIPKWQLKNQDEYEAPTEKDGNNRIVTVHDGQDSILQSVIDQTNYVYTRDWRAYSRYVKAFFGGPYFVTQDKVLTTHLFRHTFIKTLADEGNSVAEIKELTGLKSDTVVNGYINSEIELITF